MSKPGFQTSEFAAAAAAFLYAVLKAFGVLGSGNETAEIGVLTVLIAYIGSRWHLKSKVLDSVVKLRQGPQ